MISDETTDEAKRDTRDRSDYSNERALDDEDEHNASRACAHRAQDGYVRATLHDDEDERRRDIERGDEDDEGDDEKSHPALKRKRRKERAVSLLPCDGRVLAAQLLAQMCG